MASFGCLVLLRREAGASVRNINHQVASLKAEMEENEIGKAVVDPAVQVHRELGHWIA